MLQLNLIYYIMLKNKLIIKTFYRISTRIKNNILLLFHNIYLFYNVQLSLYIVQE